MRQQHETKLDNEHYIYCDISGKYNVIDNPRHGISQRFNTKAEAIAAFRNNRLDMFYIFEELRPQKSNFNAYT